MSIDEKVPIFDAELLKTMIRQSFNFDTLQTVAKAECDRLVIKVIQPQIDTWLRDIAQQINREVEQLLKKTFGDPESKQSAFKEELLKTLATKIVGNKDNMHNFIKELVSDYDWEKDPGKVILADFSAQVKQYVGEWWQTHQAQINEQLSTSIHEFLETPTAELVRKNIIATIDMINDLRKRQDELQTQISQNTTKIAIIEQGRRY